MIRHNIDSRCRGVEAPHVADRLAEVSPPSIAPRALSPVVAVLVAVALTFLPLAEQPQAVTFSLVPSVQTVDLGDAAAVDLVASDVGALTSGLGAFTASIEFDDSVLSYDSTIFYDALGDVDMGEAMVSAMLLMNVVDLYELSLVDIDPVAQGDSFRLATLLFKATGEGKSPVHFLSASYSDGLASSVDDLPLLYPEDGEITVKRKGVPIPAPGTITLVALGLFGLASPRRRRAG